MDKSKQEKLEKKGWKIGSTDDFLHLTAEEAEYIEMKIKLSNYLRSFRKTRNLTQAQLAELIHSSQSRVAKMEHGDPTVSLDLIIRSLFAMGTTKQDLAQELLT
ncbi:MAG: helix-turn-helix transcriptional regulator [Candidatus Electrothrix sp. Rat3]|nr:helix-turn-helix transcriptional regulator [Candidatus Electrothrix rattekaaiensis]